MKNREMPLFSNTCGKLFTDDIVFASAHKENTIPLHRVKSIAFKKSVTKGSLLFIIMPLVLFGLPYFVKPDETFVKIFLYGLGALLLAVCLLKAEKKYTIRIRMHNGTFYTIRVMKENIKDAQKFVSQASKLINAPQTVITPNVVTTQPEKAPFSRSVNVLQN